MNEPEFQSTASAVTDCDGQRRVQIAVPGVTFHDTPEHARTFSYSLLAAATEIELDGQDVENEERDERPEADRFADMLRSILTNWGQSPAGEWPLTLTCGRDGIGYLAFPLDVEDMPSDISERCEASRWMMANAGSPFGQGETPESALVSLREVAARIRADVARSKRALRADGSKLEELLYHDCIILGAGLNEAGERLLISTTCDDGECFRRIHAVLDEASFKAYRGGSLSFASILQAAPFYLVTTPNDGGEETIVEMTWGDLAPEDTPTADSFCPAHARWTENA